MLMLMILLGCLANAHGYWCGVCAVGDNTYCCYDDRDNTYCCSWAEYMKGGFMDMRTMTIIISVAVVVTVLLISVCCFCCPCCPCHRRRRQGTVYNSVQRASGQQGTRSPIFQTESAGIDPRLGSVQYPVQHPSNPYIDPNASAPPYYPTLTK